MNILIPQIVGDTSSNGVQFVSSTVPENDYTNWSNLTAYVIGNRVNYIGTNIHTIYECILAHSGTDPRADVNPLTGVGTKWAKVGATNRWKAFDQRINDPVIYAGVTSYVMTINSAINAVAFFGLVNGTVRVRVISSAGLSLYDQNRTIADTSSIVDWYTFFTWEADLKSEMLFTGIPGLKTATLYIDIDNAALVNAAVGEIVIGNTMALGTTMMGTSVGIEDYSRKEKDTFGGLILIPRSSSDSVNFSFALPPDDVRRVRRVLTAQRAILCVYYADANYMHFGAQVYGFFRDFDIPINAGMCFANLEIEGII